jgi:hypothetical protein
MISAESLFTDTVEVCKQQYKMWAGRSIHRCVGQGPEVSLDPLLRRSRTGRKQCMGPRRRNVVGDWTQGNTTRQTLVVVALNTGRGDPLLLGQGPDARHGARAADLPINSTDAGAAIHCC